MQDEKEKLIKLHVLVVTIKNLSMKIDDMKKERELLIDEFKKVQSNDNKLKLDSMS